MAGALTGKEESVMKTLLILDSLRGTDSTGVAVIPRAGDVKMAKQVGNPFELMDHPSFTRALQGINKAIIGHNRFGTQGKVSKQNAHPFDFDTLVGAHNGTLTNKWKLDDPHLFVVDSENLFHHIEKKGLRDAIDIVGGAWALTWWNKVENTINFLRNKERPLFATKTVDGKVMFWASEKWMLSVACSRESIAIGEIFEIAENMHHSIRVNNDGTMGKTVVSPMAAKELVQHHMNGPWTNNHGNPQIPVRHTPALPPPKDEAKNNRVVPITARHRQILSLKHGYENSKNASLEVMGESTDRLKACYYICKDVENPDADVRLYYTRRKGSKTCNTGTRLTADIGALKISPVEGSYYKVVASSVRIVSEAPVKKEQYRNSDGNWVDFNEWMNKHSTCDYCQGNVFPTEGYKFTKNKEILCAFCAQDEALEYMIS